MIPKVLFQTSKEPLPEYVTTRVKSMLDDGWAYHWFDDTAILEFFDNNPITGFENIKNVFFSFKCGAHRADLFRYYYMYLNGGVFLDSDAMLENPLSELINGLDYFFVVSTLEFLEVRNNDPVIFNGFFGTCPKSPILLELLKTAYTASPAKLDSYYLYFCHLMHKIVFSKLTHSDKVKLLSEIHDKNASTKTSLKYRDRVYATHYFENKVIPM